MDVMITLERLIARVIPVVLEDIVWQHLELLQFMNVNGQEINVILILLQILGHNYYKQLFLIILYGRSE